MTEPLHEWAEAVCSELGITGAVDIPVAVPLVLDMARDVAHGVARPAAPVTAFLMGIACGMSDQPRQAASAVAGDLSAMAGRWAASSDPPPEPS